MREMCTRHELRLKPENGEEESVAFFQNGQGVLVPSDWSTQHTFLKVKQVQNLKHE